MNLVSKALRAHWRALKNTASEPIGYRRGGSVHQLVAVVGQSESETVTMSGEFGSSTRMVDFLFDPSSFDHSVAGWMDPEHPMIGDQIIRAADQSIYDVAPGLGETCWEWSDSRHTFMRVHTVRRGKCE